MSAYIPPQRWAAAGGGRRAEKRGSDAHLAPSPIFSLVFCRFARVPELRPFESVSAISGVIVPPPLPSLPALPTLPDGGSRRRRREGRLKHAREAVRRVRAVCLELFLRPMALPSATAAEPSGIVVMIALGADDMYHRNRI